MCYLIIQAMVAVKSGVRLSVTILMTPSYLLAIKLIVWLQQNRLEMR